MLCGDLLERSRLLIKRLDAPLYKGEELFAISPGWPGDFYGRALLAKTSLYLAMEGYPEEQEKLLSDIKEMLLVREAKLNEDRYFGNLLQTTYVDEQQLSGNSWYIRGLCRAYRILRDDSLLEDVRRIAERLLIPLAPLYDSYDLRERGDNDGGVSGHLMKKEGGIWQYSSDVGCAFILLDGYVNAYEVLRTEKLKQAVIHVIDRFSHVPYVELKCQTHATMTVARSILRFYDLTGEKRYLEMAKEIYRVYREQGMTLDYQNINWFGRPDSWTEPCCVVDSWILAKHLYLDTEEFAYLKDFNRIYLNGLRTLQRDNGGAGCSTLALEGHSDLCCSMYEAFFCCTMRLGEGLYELKTFPDDLKGIVIPYAECYKGKGLEIHNHLYKDGVIDIVADSPMDLTLYLPFGEEAFATMKLQKGKNRFEYEITPHREEPLTLIGDLILTRKGEDAEFTPIADSRGYTEEELGKLVQHLE